MQVVNTILALVRGAVAAAGWLLALGTAASLSRHPNSVVRFFDFPRVQIMGLCATFAGLYAALLARRGRRWSWHDRLFMAAMGAVVVRQAWAIWRFTPLAPVAIKSRRPEAGGGGGGLPAEAIKLVISNVLLENDRHDRWLEVVTREDPDVVLAAEVDERWVSHLDPVLSKDRPHKILRPQGNYYGMGLWSRLPLSDSQVRFTVQDDIPSIRTKLRLRSGAEVVLFGLHPRPPTPDTGQSSAPRDAELILVGREIERTTEQDGRFPVIVAGDLNDVAWSGTTDLFVRIARLLDPRQGRGLYNTFNANSSWMRIPLDHVFVSDDFRLLDLRVLEHVGSDHLPVCITLLHDPAAEKDQEAREQDEGDREEAQRRIDTQREREREGKEQGHLTRDDGGA